MPTKDWAKLVTYIDKLISELRNSRAEVRRWRTRATELERLSLKEERVFRVEDQAKDRELDKLRRERKKIIPLINKIIKQLEQAQNKIQGESHE